MNAINAVGWIDFIEGRDEKSNTFFSFQSSKFVYRVILRYESRSFNGRPSSAFRTHVWLKGFNRKAVSNMRSLNPQLVTSI